MDWFERITEELDSRGLIERRAPGQVRARCPSHTERHGSLVVKRLDGGRALPTCFGRCPRATVVKALGLDPAEVFANASPHRDGGTRPPVVATYPYTDAAGVLVAEKLRDAAKRFWWRQPDAARRGGWRWDLNGLRDRGLPSLYRWTEIRGRPLVFKVEGEKAADRLVELGLAATCGPHGVRWTDANTRDLLGAVPPHAVIVVIADNDPPGLGHARNVAHALLAGESSVVVKLIDDLNVPRGGDVFDFLERASVDELLERVASEPAWSPAADAATRDARRRQRRTAVQRRRRAERRGSRVVERASARDVRVNAALAAIVEALRSDHQPKSGRRLWAIELQRAHERHVVYEALARAVERGLLLRTQGPRRADLYGLPLLPGLQLSGHSTPTRRDTETLLSSKDPTSVRVSEALKPEAHVNKSFSSVQKDPPVITEASRSGHSPSVLQGPHQLGHSSEQVSDEHRQAIDDGYCCGRDGEEPRCRLCRWSVSYWQRDAQIAEVTQ